MVIVAGHVIVGRERRDDYLDGCGPVVEQARRRADRDFRVGCGLGVRRVRRTRPHLGSQQIPFTQSAKASYTQLTGAPNGNSGTGAGVESIGGPL
jgi:hypothetical protein